MSAEVLLVVGDRREAEPAAILDLLMAVADAVTKTDDPPAAPAARAA